MATTTHDEVTDPGINAWCRLHDFRLGEQARTLDDHEKRLRDLERIAWRVGLSAATGAGLAGGIVSALPVIVQALK